MSSASRFGRRVPLPSTRDIMHELRMMMHADRIRLLERDLRKLTEAQRLAAATAAPPAA